MSQHKPKYVFFDLFVQSTIASVPIVHAMYIVHSVAIRGRLKLFTSSKLINLGTRTDNATQGISTREF